MERRQLLTKTCSAGGTLERFVDYPNITARQIGSPRSPVAIVLGGKSAEDTFNR
jgi:hypothetical protein